MSAAGGAMVLMASVPTIAPPATAGAVWVWQPVGIVHKHARGKCLGVETEGTEDPKQMAAATPRV